MTAEPQFRTEERAGLFVAVGLHVLLAAVFLFQPEPEKTLSKPQSMTVSLATDVGLEATAPEIVLESQASVAPILSDTQAQLDNVDDAVDPLETIPAPQTQSVEAPNQPKPKPAAKPKPKPKPKPAAKPKPKPKPAAKPKPKPAAKPKPKPKTAGGGSRVGNDFLGGAGSSTKTSETRIPASQIGASAQASLRSAINRQLKPHWTSPTGVDADKLVTILSFRLNEKGALVGKPRVVRQSGVNAANRAQADLHAERAIRAVQLAAPFDLPDKYYNSWKNIKSWKFDRRL